MKKVSLSEVYRLLEPGPQANLMAVRKVRWNHVGRRLAITACC
jgi:hypothetical protein